MRVYVICLALIVLGVWFGTALRVRTGHLVTVDGHRTVQLHGCPACDSMKAHSHRLLVLK